jgi:hypothetical protein
MEGNIVIVSRIIHHFYLKGKLVLLVRINPSGKFKQYSPFFKCRPTPNENSEFQSNKTPLNLQLQW